MHDIAGIGSAPLIKAKGWERDLKNCREISKRYKDEIAHRKKTERNRQIRLASKE
jgi:hypothetical protein